MEYDPSRPSAVQSAPRRMSRPLSEVPASELNRRRTREAWLPATEKSARGKRELFAAQSSAQGATKNDQSSSWSVNTASAASGVKRVLWPRRDSPLPQAPHHGAAAQQIGGDVVDGRHSLVSGGVRQVSAVDGQARNKGVSVEQQTVRHGERDRLEYAKRMALNRDRTAAQHRGSLPFPAPSIFRPAGTLHSGRTPKSGPQAAQSSRSSSTIPPSVPRSTTAGAVRPAHLPLPQPKGEAEDYFNRTGVLTHPQPSALARPSSVRSKAAISKTPRYTLEPGTSLSTINRLPHCSSAPTPTQLTKASGSRKEPILLLSPDIEDTDCDSGAASDSESGSDFEHMHQPHALHLLAMDDPDLFGVGFRPNAEEDIRRLLQDLPDIDIPPEDRANTPIQMAIELMPHQKVALKWLKDQENNRSKKGGLLADTMGLGKTIEALALIVSHKPPASGPKTTLIVAPLALLKQWSREIEQRLKPAHRLTTFIYHGRQKRTRAADRLYDYDVVITTYESIAYEYTHVGSDGKRRSPLFSDPRGFYRIILDEAHKIRNRNTSASKAVAELRAEFRLCMTGTPFMNRTAEIFPLVRFLQIAPYCDWRDFNYQIETPLRKWQGDDKAESMRRLQVLFHSITLRRTKDSVLDGSPVLTLPELTITPVFVELDVDQRSYYTMLEEKHQRIVSDYLKRNRLHDVITYILVLLTRLRQVCDHPYLTQNHGIPVEAKLNRMQMMQLATKFDAMVASAVLKKKDFECPLCEQSVESPIIIFPCGHDLCPDCFSNMMQVRNQASRNAEDSQSTLVGIIGGVVNMETKCPHDGCESEVSADKIVCHGFLLDAYSLGRASQSHDGDSDDEDEDSTGSSDDEDEDDSEDDSEDLRDFIVSDGDEDSEIDSERSESDEDTVQDLGRDDVKCEGPTCAGRSPAPDAFVSSNEAVEANEVAVKKEADTGTEYPITYFSGAPASGHGQLSAEEIQSHQSPVPHAGPSDEKKSAPATDLSIPDYGNDVWGRALARLEKNEIARSEEDSDSDLESLNAVVTKANAKSAAAPSKQSTAKRKREVASGKTQVSVKRVKRHEEMDKQERPRKRRNGGKTGKKKDKKDKKGKGTSMAELKKHGSTSKAAKIKYNERLRRDWESSAKVDATIDLLRKIREEKPTEKTLVFSIWTSFLDLLEIPMQDENFTYLRYDGSMTFNERDENVRAFCENPRQKILLVSLMAGNAGLNLTAATQVIILEPFWNPFVEDQAIDRAHRIGQKMEVHVHKLLVPDSVEDRILALQEKKRQLVDTALSAEGAEGASRLSIDELRGLFGLR